MNAPTPETSRTRIAELRQRVQQLSQSAAADLRKSDHKRNLLFIAGAAMSVVLLTSLSFLTSMAFQLDAQALTEIGRHEVQDQLPESRRALKDYLEAHAPEFTAQFIAAATGMVPQLRPLVLQELEHHLHALTADFEQRLVQLMESSVRTTKSDLDKNFPDLSDAEKFDLLVSTVASKFNENTRALIGELYPQYSREMQRVTDHLTALRTTDATHLSQQERTEREIIETLLRLIAREHGEEPDATP